MEEGFHYNVNAMKKNGSTGHAKSQLNRNRLLIIAICLALILKIGLFIYFQPWKENVEKEEILHDDAEGYHNLASAIIRNKNFSYFHEIRTPGYPVFIAIVYTVFGKQPWVVLLFQIFINSVSVLLLFRIGKVLFPEQMALWGSILFALDPHQILYTVHLLAETLFITMLLASVYTLVLGLQSNKGKHFILSGFLLGISTLIKPISQYLPFVLIVFILLYKNQPMLAKIRVSLVYLIVFFLTLSPWMIRNYIKYEYFSLCSVKGHNLLHHHIPHIELWKTGGSFRQIQKDFVQKAEVRGATHDIDGFKRSKIYKEVAIEYIKNHKIDYFRSHIRGMFNMYKGTDTEDITRKLRMDGPVLGRDSFYKSKTIGELIVGIPIGFFLMICYLAGLYGTLYLIKERRYYELIFLLLIIINFSILTGVVGDARYKLPITPYYILLSGLGINRFVLLKKKKNKNINT